MKKIIYAITAIVIIVALSSGFLAGSYLTQSKTGQQSPDSTTTATSSTQPTTQKTITINGDGATFPQPLLTAMITQYTSQIEANLQINYAGVGSGQGISDFESKVVDFAASDAPLGASDMAKAPNALQIPETIGAVTIAYNLPGIGSGLHLTGQAVVDIFQGKITMWNDSEIQSLNTNITLPSNTIQVVHRSEGSGTTFIFTGYLSASSSSWNSSIGQGKTVPWPVGIGAQGNPGVASVVQGTTYMVGYVELAYALSNNMTVAAVQNLAGNWVLPTLDSTQNAVESGSSGGLPAGDQSWTNVNLINAPGPQAYPIVSFTYLLSYKELNVVPGMTQTQATALVQFLWWVIHDGQQLSSDLKYAQLPSNVVLIDEASIQSITFNGQHLQTS